MNILAKAIQLSTILDPGLTYDFEQEFGVDWQKQLDVVIEESTSSNSDRYVDYHYALDFRSVTSKTKALQAHFLEYLSYVKDSNPIKKSVRIYYHGSKDPIPNKTFISKHLSSWTLYNRASGYVRYHKKIGKVTVYVYFSSKLKELIS